MREQFYFLFMLLLLLVQNGWSQCDYTVTESIGTENVILQGDNINGFFRLTYTIDTPGSTAAISMESDNPAIPAQSGFFSSNNPSVNWLFDTEFACGEPWPLEGSLITTTIVENGCETVFEEILTLNVDSLCGNDMTGGGTDVDDSRQIGQLIEGLGDGEVVQLNGDGNILAFSSANGIYVCELIGETWTPIGGEIFLDTVAIGGIEEIFLSTDGNAIWVQGAENVGCVYRNGSGFDVSQQVTLASSIGPTNFFEIFDLSGNGNFVLARGFNADGLEEFGCFSVTGQGQLALQIALAPFEFGYLSNNGEYFCTSNAISNTTTVYNGVNGTEIAIVDGVVRAASEDLSTCLVDLSTGMGFISRWEIGTTTFTNSTPFPIENIGSYGFSNTGNACVGLNVDGTVEVSTFTESEGSLLIESTPYTVEGLNNITAVNISGTGERLIFSNGSGSENAVCVYDSELMFAATCSEWVLEGIEARFATSNISADGFIQGSFTYAPIITGIGSDAVDGFLWDDGTTEEERTIPFSFQQGGEHPLDGQTISITIFESEICSSEVELLLNFPNTQIGQVIESETPNGVFGRDVVAIDGAGQTIAFSSNNGMVICTLENNAWVEVSEPFEGGSSGDFSTDGSVFVSGNVCAYRNEAGTYDVIEGLTTTNGEEVSVSSVTGDGTGVYYQTNFTCGFGRIVESGVIETITEEFFTPEEQFITFSQVSTDGNFYCFTIEGFDGGNAFSSIVEVSTEETISTFPGRIEAASGDLSTCLISNLETGMVEISRWDGETTFTTAPFSGFNPLEFNTSYSFNGDGSFCVGSTPNGTVACTEIIVEGEAFSFNTEEFTVGLNSYTNATITDSGNRFVVGTGSSFFNIFSDEPRFEPTGSNVTVFNHIELEDLPELECNNGLINIVGNASEIEDRADSYILTPNENGQFGAIWSESFIDLNADFSIEANLNFGDRDAPGPGINDIGADGIAFVLQGQCNGQGSIGRGIGFAGIDNSIAIEFDDFQNPELGDPEEDHVGIQQGGSVDHNTNSLAGPIALDTNLEDGADHAVRISWSATSQTITVMLDGVMVTEYTGDIINEQLAGLNNVYWGFTSATGASRNLHQVNDICLEATNIPTSEVIGSTCDNPNTTINFLLPEVESATITYTCLLYTSPSPRDATLSRMPSSA